MPDDWLRRCDITLLDFVEWGYVKSKINVHNSALIQALEQNIKSVVRQIPLEMLERVIENWTQLDGPPENFNVNYEQQLKKFFIGNLFTLIDQRK